MSLLTDSATSSRSYGCNTSTNLEGLSEVSFRSQCVSDKLFILTLLPAAPRWAGFSGLGPFWQTLSHAARATRQSGPSETIHKHRSPRSTKPFLLCVQKSFSSREASFRGPRTFWSMSGKCSSMMANDFPFIAKWYRSCVLRSSSWHTSSKLTFTSCESSKAREREILVACNNCNRDEPTSRSAPTFHCRSSANIFR